MLKNYPLPNVAWSFSLHASMHFPHTICLLFLHLACVKVLLGVPRYLRDVEVTRAIEMLQDGSSRRKVAAAFGVTQSVVSRLWNHFQTTGGHARHLVQGRTCCTTARRIAASGKWLPGAATSMTKLHERLATGVRISDYTVRSRLHEENLRSRRPVR